MISLKYKTGDDLKTPYRIVASVGFVFAVTGFILSFQENDTKFKFKNIEENEGNLGIDSLRFSSEDDDNNNKEKKDNEN